MRLTSRVFSPKGFTLIELLIVIAVIGILAAVTLVLINPLQQIRKARDAQRKTDLRTIANALEQYATGFGTYPVTFTGATPITTNYWSNCITWGPSKGPNGWIPGLVAGGVVKKLPLDPVRKTSTAAMTNSGANYTSPETFCYLYVSNGKDYKVAADCGVEADFATSGQQFHNDNGNWWACDSKWTYALYTPGAQNW